LQLRLRNRWPPLNTASRRARVAALSTHGTLLRPVEATELAQAPLQALRRARAGARRPSLRVGGAARQTAAAGPACEALALGHAGLRVVAATQSSSAPHARSRASACRHVLHLRRQHPPQQRYSLRPQDDILDRGVGGNTCKLAPSELAARGVEQLECACDRHGYGHLDSGTAASDIAPRRRTPCRRDPPRRARVRRQLWPAQRRAAPAQRPRSLEKPQHLAALLRGVARDVTRGARIHFARASSRFFRGQPVSGTAI